MRRNVRIFGLEIEALPANGETLQRVNGGKNNLMDKSYDRKQAHLQSLH